MQKYLWEYFPEKSRVELYGRGRLFAEEERGGTLDRSSFFYWNIATWTIFQKFKTSLTPFSTP